MTEAINFAAIAGPVLTDIVAGALTSASLQVGRRAQKGLKKLRGAPGHRSNMMLVELLTDAPSAENVTLTSLVSLPECGLNAMQLRRMLDSQTMRTAVQQLYCAVLLNSSEDVFAKVESAFILAFNHTAALISSPKAELNAASLEFFSILRQNADRLFNQNVDDESREPIAELFAQLTLIAATVDRVDSFMESLTARQNPDHVLRQREWEILYRRQCSKRHGVITPPDFKERNTVPLDQIYVPARISVVDGDKDEQADSVSLYDVIDHLDRDVLVGDPGGGKSTTTHAIAYKLAETPDAIFPFVVVLREYAPHSDELSVVQYVEKQLRTIYQAPAPDGAVESLFSDGNALVIFDGLDELIDSSRRVAIAERIELFSSRYPSARIYVTSRKVGYKEARLDPDVFRILELEGYSDTEIEEYVSKWFAIQSYQDNVDVEGLRKAFMDESSSIREIRSNPLLLALLCIIYRGQGYLPKHRVGIYEECSKLLFETWDKSRGIVFDFSFERYISDALKHLALWMFQAEDSEEGVTEHQLIRELTDFFQDRTYETTDAAERAAAEFVEFCSGRAWVLSEAGMTSEGESLFKFTHRTFMEYFAAIQITRLHPEPRKLARFLLPKVAKNEWDTVGQLAVHLIHRSAERGGEIAIGQLLDSSVSRSIIYRENVLAFVARCLADLHAGPALVKQTVRSSVELLTRLHSTPQHSPALAALNLSSWRRLLQMERAETMKIQVIREEFDEIVEELLEPDSSNLHIEVAALLLDGMSDLYWHRRLVPAGASEHGYWSEFAIEKWKKHKKTFFGLDSYRQSIAQQMQIQGSLSFEELRNVISEPDDFPLDFAFRSYPRLAEPSRANANYKGVPLNYRILAGASSHFMPSNEVRQGFLELSSGIASIAKLNRGPLVRLHVMNQFDQISVAHLIDETLPSHVAENNDAWGAVAVMVAIHIENELLQTGITNRIKKDKLRRRDSFYSRLMTSRLFGSSALEDSEIKSLKETWFGEQLDGWIRGKESYIGM